MDPDRLSDIAYLLEEGHLHSDELGDIAGRRRRAGIELLAEVRNARKLARAVILFYKGTWNDSDRAEWCELTDTEAGDLCDPEGRYLRKLAYEVMR